MKSIKNRILSSIMIICMSAMLMGCAACNHEEITPATCVDSAACVACGKTFGKPIGHATNSGYCYRCDSYVNCLKLENEMVSAIEERCHPDEFADIDMKALNDKLGVEFDKDTAQLSTGSLQDEYLYNIEFSVKTVDKDYTYVVNRNFYAIEDEEASLGWSIKYHDETTFTAVE